MSDDKRVYSDEEFALILRKAAELTPEREPSAASSDGLTLAEIKAAAAQAGFDPALIERAARQLTITATDSPAERVIGGPIRHQVTLQVPLTLDETSAARLLSVIRIAAGQSGSYEGHSSALGIIWHDGGELESLQVAARPEANGTSVSLGMDRRGTLLVTSLFGGMGLLMVVLFGATMYAEVSPAVGVATAVAGSGGVLAVARAYWASSARKVRERMQSIVDAIAKP